MGRFLIFEKRINGEITTSLKSVVSVVCQIQGRSALHRPAKAGRKPNRKMANISQLRTLSNRDITGRFAESKFSIIPDSIKEYKNHEGGFLVLPH